jgi:hypothetical protein
MEPREPKRFKVRYEDGRLWIEWLGGEPALDLEPDDIVIFNFTGIPSGHVPGVFFLSHDFLGPFQNMHQTADSIVLKGNSGRTGTFRCTPWISPKISPGMPQEKPLMADSSVKIENQIDTPRPATHVRVLVRYVGGKLTAEVDAEKISVNETDVVIWSFVFGQGIPDKFHPLLYFQDSERPWGPFGSLSSLPAFETTAEGEVRFRLVGEGITSEKHSFAYSVGVVRVLLGDTPGLGDVLRVEHDPVIDSSGPPNR